MCGVVKLHIEPFDKLCREGTHRRLIRIETRMADRTHRTVIVRRLIGYELVEVAANARIVTGVFEGLGFSVSPVTRHAVKLFVLGDLVVKGGEGRIGRFYNRRFRCLGGRQRDRHFVFLFETACAKQRQGG